MTQAAPRRPRMGVIMTIPMCIRAYMGPHIRRLSERFDITLVANGSVEEVSELLSERVCFQPLDIRRDVAIGSDLRSLLALWRLARRQRFDVVHSMTPKGGVLAMLAAKAALVPVRVHCFTGQVWATRTGFARAMLKTIDRMLVRCATHLFADSRSQRQYLSEQGIVRPDRVTVLGEGSVCGVDMNRFKPDPARRARLRAELAIPETAIVALYVGRLNVDKGLRELAEAFAVAAQTCPDLHLLVVGPDESGMRELMSVKLAPCLERVRFVGGTKEPELYMASGDFFVLPSYREGFGLTVIESAACGLPTIGTRVYGLTDSIIDEQTGLLVPPRDPAMLAAAMMRIASDAALRKSLGAAARARAEAHFREEQFTNALWCFYEGLLPEPAETRRSR